MAMNTGAEPRFKSGNNIREYLGAIANVASVDGPRTIDLFVYGGSALLLASNFRDATDDIDAFIRVDNPAPVDKNRDLKLEALWLQNWAGMAKPSHGNGNHKWLDTGVYMTFAGSSVNLAEREHHIYLETISAGKTVMDVYVPDKSLMLAIKVDTMRINDDNPSGKPKDLDDILNLMALHPEIKNDTDLIDFSAKYFPEIRGKKHVVNGAKEIFSRHRERPRHTAPVYAAGSSPKTQP